MFIKTVNAGGLLLVVRAGRIESIRVEQVHQSEDYTVKLMLDSGAEHIIYTGPLLNSNHLATILTNHLRGYGCPKGAYKELFVVDHEHLQRERGSKNVV